jgi:predicted nucleic acid-binding protein
VKVFFDTNVWVSAVVFPGLCAELLVATAESGHAWLTTPLVRDEAHEVLRRKFARHAQALMRFDLLWARSIAVADVAEPADDADARLVAAAALAGAALFVTGDQRVIGWQGRGNLRIVSPREAWAAIMAPGG